MTNWNMRTETLELKDGSTIKNYHYEFNSTDRVLAKIVEDVFKGIMDINADRKTEPTGYNLSPVDKDINVRSKTEPQTDGILFKGNLKEGECKLIKTTNGWVLEGNDIAYCGEPQTEVTTDCRQTDCPWK